MGKQVITVLMAALRRLTIPLGTVLYFDVNRSKSVAAVKWVMVGNQKLFPVAQRRPEIAEPEQGDSLQVETVEVVKQLVKLPDKAVCVLVEGLERVEFLCLEVEEPAMTSGIAAVEVEKGDLDSLAQEAMLRILKDKLGEYGRVNSRTMEEILSSLLTITDLSEILNQIVIQLLWDYTIHRTVLGNNSLSARYGVVTHTLLTEVEIYRIKKDFQEKAKASIDQNQREYTLREQMKVICQGLGEDAVLDADEYQKKLDALKADRGVKEKLHKEIEYFRNMPAGSQEANVLRTYAETLLDLPWKGVPKDNDDVKHAEKILGGDHCELEQIKERILRYLVVHALTKKDISPIICPVGFPGIGKTSTARFVVRTLDKKYVRINLGGVRGEVEIRGHRKTCVGVTPGRIVEGMRWASVSNPLMPLDEVDKVSSDYKSDISSASLEVLDGGQNVKFRNHYMKLPIDLSQVLFVVAASTIQTVSGPLLGRMGLIEVNSYTENERFHIARDYLMSKQVERSRLKDSQVTLSDKNLEKTIHNYTREAGVRNLKHRIRDVCRKAAGQLPEGERKSIKTSESNLEGYLGKEKVTFESADEGDEVGVVCSLAWTSVGGDTLQIEANVMPGKGSLLITG